MCRILEGCLPSRSGTVLATASPQSLCCGRPSPGRRYFLVIDWGARVVVVVCLLPRWRCLRCCCLCVSWVVCWLVVSSVARVRCPRTLERCLCHLFGRRRVDTVNTDQSGKGHPSEGALIWIRHWAALHACLLPRPRPRQRNQSWDATSSSATRDACGFATARIRQ